MAISVPQFLQTKKYTAKAVREALLHLNSQPGVYGASGSLKVNQRAAGANMSVDVNGGGAWVDGTTSSLQGRYHVNSDAISNLVIGANGSGNPRVDQVVLRIYDTTDGSAAQDAGAIEVLPGVATAGAQITNAAGANYRSGAAALPVSSIRLADIAVPSGAASIVDANIIDRRPWSRGFYRRIVRNANAAAGSDYTTASTSFTAIDASGASSSVSRRFEVSSATGLVEVTFRGAAQHSVSNEVIALSVRSDNVDVMGVETDGAWSIRPGLTTVAGFSLGLTLSLAQGSHFLAPFWKVFTGTGTIKATSKIPFEIVFREVISQDDSNGTI